MYVVEDENGRHASITGILLHDLFGHDAFLRVLIHAARTDDIVAKPKKQIATYVIHKKMLSLFKSEYRFVMKSDDPVDGFGYLDFSANGTVRVLIRYDDVDVLNLQDIPVELTSQAGDENTLHIEFHGQDKQSGISFVLVGMFDLRVLQAAFGVELYLHDR